MIKANAFYTGGGFYLYTGEILKGKYFLTDNEDDYTMISDADPEEYLEECFYEEWFNKHRIGELIGGDHKANLLEAFDWILKNNPKGNYSFDDIEKAECRLHGYVPERR